jgi:murein DD-endopeptidase MepM/ murein hydrolase activator NlpD
MDNINNTEKASVREILAGILVKPAKLPFVLLILELFTDFFFNLGKSICEILSDLAKSSLLFLGKAIGYAWVKTENFRGYLLGKLKYAGIFLASPFLKRITAYKEMRRALKDANRDSGLLLSFRVFFRYFFGWLFGRRGALATVFNYAAPIISIVFLVNVVSYATAIDYAVRLDINGQFVGYIENELVFSEAQKIFEDRLNFLGRRTYAETVPQFTIEKVGNSDTMNAFDIVNIMMSNSGIRVDNAFGITINGTFWGAVQDNARILETLDSLLNAHRRGFEDEEVFFLWPVDCEQAGMYPVDSFVDPQDVIRSITQIREPAQYYLVREGDSHSSVTSTLDMTATELDRLNPGFAGMTLTPGMRILYSAAVPALPVAVSRIEVYDEAVPYQTVRQDYDNLFEGQTNIGTRGVPGVRRVTARVTLVNGVETGRHIEGEPVIITAPVTEVVLRGTKPVPVNNPHSIEVPEHNKFIWPLPRASSRLSEWGWWDGGYRGHHGIDIAAPHGTPVYAGRSGTVTFSGWSSGLGNYITIDHGDGYSTLYSHQSQNIVRRGDRVIQGEVIGFVGRTGIATGNHLHFEVRKNGTRVNPRHYLTFH